MDSTIIKVDFVLIKTDGSFTASRNSCRGKWTSDIRCFDTERYLTSVFTDFKM